MKLDLDAIREHARVYHNDTGSCYHADMIPFLQVQVFVMCGMGWIGKTAAEQPADFYIDSRVGRLPYGKGEIYQAVEVLKIIAEENGLDPHNMPRLPMWHTGGVG